jgi:hypothetical protein
MELTAVGMVLYRRRARGAMPEPMPRDPVRTMRRQVARVRWRKNLYEIQRAVYGLTAVGAGGAAAGVLVALRADATTFAAAAWAIAAGTVVAIVVVGIATARRWLGARRAPG